MKLPKPPGCAAPPQSVRWVITVALSLGLGAAFSSAGLPAGWILAGILGSGSVALLTRSELPLNRHVYNLSRGIVGIIAAMPLVSVPLGLLGRTLAPAVVFSIVSVAFALACGMWLGRHREGLDERTGALSMLPGAASMIPMLATEMGANYRFVALTQYLRLLIVSATLPFVAHLLATPDSGGGAELSHAPLDPVGLALIVVISLIGAPIARRFRIPVPGVFGPMIIAVALGLVLPSDTVSLAPPFALEVFAFMSVGWLCGGGLSVPALKLFAKQMPATITIVVVLMALCGGCAVGMSAWLGISMYDAYLATSPGGLETVLALSAEGDAGAVVITGQLVRLIIVLLVAGWLPRFSRMLGGKR